MIPLFAQHAPSAPGIYMMKDAFGTVLYVGKAKDLKHRVASYFANKKHDSKTLQLVSRITDIEFIVTSNETEALILESNLIKKFKGKYNVDLKESYRYPYVKITREDFPQIVVVREPKKNFKSGERVFGPFVDGAARHQMIDRVEKTFKIRTCHPLPKKACLKFYMGQCTAPCIAKVSKEAYGVQIQKAVDFFSGKREEVMAALEIEMHELASKQLFELALERRKALELLRGKFQRQSVDVFKRRDQDFIAIEETPTGIVILLLPFRRGTLLGKKTFRFESKLVSTDILEDFLLEYYSENASPNEIVLSTEVFNRSEIESVLSETAGERVLIESNPKSGPKKRMLNLAKTNLSFFVNPEQDPLLELSRALLLSNPPKRMECFDVSHMGGADTAASLVVFENGKPNKRQYRHFLIRSAGASDDYAAMFEVLHRRFAGVLSQELPAPNLVVLDGGKGQLRQALKVFSELKLSFPVIALAKRNEEVFVPARETPILLGRKSPALKLLTALRDEAHRFANRLRKKQVKKKLKVR